MRSDVLLQTLLIISLKVADLALESGPGLGIAMDLHVELQVTRRSVGSLTHVANVGTSVGMADHVKPESGFVIEALAADVAELAKFLGMTSDVKLKHVLRAPFRATYVTHVGTFVKGHVEDQIGLLLEELFANVTLHRTRWMDLLGVFPELLIVRAPFLAFRATNANLAQVNGPMSRQVQLLRKFGFAVVALVHWRFLRVCWMVGWLVTSSVIEQQIPRGEKFVAQIASYLLLQLLMPVQVDL